MATEPSSGHWQYLRLHAPAPGVAVLALHRPDKRNALSLALRREFDAALHGLAQDDAVRVLVLTGSHGTFTAGLDLDEWAGAADPLPPGAALALGAGAFDSVTDPVAALERLGKPVVGAIEGPCITGGLEIALACDLLVAATTARFADTHVRVGLLPGWGGSVRLAARIGPARAREVALTGRMLPAAEAAAWGLVNRVVEPAALLDEAVALAASIAAHPPAHVAAYRALLAQEAALPGAQALALEARVARAHNLAVSRDDLLQRLDRLRRQAPARSGG